MARRIVAGVFAILAVTWLGELTLVGGPGYLVMALLICSAAWGRWEDYLFWLIILSLSRFFAPSDWMDVALMLIVSLGAFAVFQRWIDRQNPGLAIAALTILVALMIVGSYAVHQQYALPAFLGSLGLTIPVVLVWCAMMRPWDRRRT